MQTKTEHFLYVNPSETGMQSSSVYPVSIKVQCTENLNLTPIPSVLSPHNRSAVLNE